MNRITIQLTALVAKVKELAQASPDNRYSKPMEILSRVECTACSNIRGLCTNGSEGCIIGQALLALGVDRAILADHEHDSVRNLLRATSDLYDKNTVEMEWLVHVQLNQDGGLAWSYAVQEASRIYGLTYV